MTDPTPQTTTRDEAVEAIVDQVEDVVLTDWFRHTGDPEASRRVVVRAVVSRMLASAPAPASGRVDAVKEDAREFVAKIVYAAMKWAAERAERGKPPEWVERGNSLAQSEARRVAHNITDYVAASLSPAATPVSEAGGEADWNGIARRMQRAGAPGTEEELEAALRAALAKPASSPTGGDVVREALREIAEQDVTEIALDPDWPRRIAKAALSQSTSAGRVGE